MNVTGLCFVLLRSDALSPQLTPNDVTRLFNHLGPSSDLSPSYTVCFHFTFIAAKPGKSVFPDFNY